MSLYAAYGSEMRDLQRDLFKVISLCVTVQFAEAIGLGQYDRH
jgi:hypothetical protein